MAEGSQEVDHRPIAALYVETDGTYFGHPGVDAYDIVRDARNYDGPHPVVAHPPCQRWGRYWHGSPAKPHQYRLGADSGCFASALTACRNFGGVIEHPKDSSAWKWFGLKTPPRSGGWVQADDFGGWTCCVDQGHYGHVSDKSTWLYANGVDLPELLWGSSQKGMVEYIRKDGRPGRRSAIEMAGGKDKTRIRNATPEAFKEVLLKMARTAYDRKEAKKQ